MSTRLALLHPNPQRPLLLDLGLATSALFVWFLLGCLDIQIAAATHQLKLIVVAKGWRGSWPLGPWLVAISALLLFYGRTHFTSSGPLLQERLQRLSLFAAALIAIRLISLWPTATWAFPFLTLLWSPHATWALALVFFAYIHWPQREQVGDGRNDSGDDAEAQNLAQLDRDGDHAPQRAFGRCSKRLYTALALFVICLLTYSAYTLYFCQITMLHGDEGQYLRVTQSLLVDGDMDLANNLDEAQTNEFHVRGFGVQKAPGSPAGKVHSVHPIGLSIAAMPAYWLGQELWNNARLGSALLMVLLASSCVPLLFLWLTRINVAYVPALVATLIMCCTGPFFLFTNQLFPEVAALFIALVVLCTLTHWQIPAGRYQALAGRLELPALVLLTLLLSCLPFLHARYAPIGLLAGAGVLAQAWYGARRKVTLAAIAAAILLGLYALIAFHFAFSNDWMGPFRPGNAWEEGALDITTWSISLPGHWLHVGKGMLNSSPVFFFALLGWAALVRARDRRILVVLGIYGATAATNGLHPDWGFGFCYPARFLVTALPATVYGLAIALPLLLRRPATTFLIALALVASVESILHTLVLTEMGYNGLNLLGRQLNHYYPFALHFFPPNQTATPLYDGSFWLLLAAALYVGLVHLRNKPASWRAAVALAAALLPLVWGQTDVAASRLQAHALSPYMTRIRPGYPLDRPNPLQFGVALRPMVAEAMQDGRIVAQAGVTAATLLNASSFSLPLLHVPHPGIYQIDLPDLTVENAEGQTTGHLLVTSRNTVQAVSPWERRFSQALIGGQPKPDKLVFHVEKPNVQYIYLEYAGSGALALGPMQATFVPMPMRRQSELVHRFVAGEDTQGEDGIILGASYPKLPPGHYRARYRIEGSTFSTFFQRLPPPLVMAVYAGPAEPTQLENLARAWFLQERISFTTSGVPSYTRPLAEQIVPPWWASIPLASETAFDLPFHLTSAEDVWFLLRYQGEEDLAVREVVLYRDHYEGF